MSEFSQKLNRWYNKNARDLPWRDTRDPYKIWISEVMLQQTTVSAVIPYYNKWIKKFPTIQHVSRATPETILKQWQGLGYYSRARNIHKTAKIITQEYKGLMPNSVDLLRKLPGFGPYTVGAVLSIAFDRREPIIDANVRRVFMRLLAREGIADVSQDDAIYRKLDEVMPKCNLRTFNQALMELGALICRKNGPTCTVCPVRKFCKAADFGIQEIIPQAKTKNIQNLEVSIGIIMKKDKYFIQKRQEKGLLADLWEFPGGKIEKGETPEEAVKREVFEEVGIKVKNTEYFMNTFHAYTQFRLNLHVFKCTTDDSIKPSKTRKWVTESQLTKYPMPSGSARIVDRILASTVEN